MAGAVAERVSDAVVSRLAHLFQTHPAWLSAARVLRADANSAVYFSHLPGEPWQLFGRNGTTHLEPGLPEDPDFVFRFTPASVDRLAAVRGGVGVFAIELFSLILEEDEDVRIGFRIVSSLPTLAGRGYLHLLVAGGPRVLAFGAKRGVRGLADLHRLVRRLSSRGPEPWEVRGA